MVRDTKLFQTRRSLLQTTGASITGIVGLQAVSPALAESDEASVSVEDQESDGTSLVISASTEDEGRLIILPQEERDGFDPQYIMMILEAGTEFSDRTIQLDRYLFESKGLAVRIESGRRLVAKDEAFVEVDPSYPIDMTVDDPNVTYVLPPDDAEFYHPYVLYTPAVSDEQDTSETRPVFVERGQPPINDVEKLAEFAVNNLSEGGSFRREMAEEYEVPFIIPAFPGLHGPLAPSNMDLIDYHSLTADDPRNVRYDLQLLAMIEDVKERLTEEPYPISDKIHIHGSSSSATFASRFAILHPERVTAISAGTTGQHTLPKETVGDDVPVINQPDNETLLYPVGVGDLAELIGEEFNADAWKEIEKFYWMGGDDQPDPDEDPRSYRSFVNLPTEREEQMLNVFGTKRIDERFAVTQSVYQAVDPSAQFTIYEGWGHTTEPAIDDIMRFHQNQLSYEPTEEDRDDSTVDDGATDGDGTTDDSSPEEERDTESAHEEEERDTESAHEEEERDTESAHEEENETTPTNGTDDEIPGLGAASALAGVGGIIAYGLLSPDEVDGKE